MADDPKQAWDEVGERFSDLGRTIKDRYRSGGEADQADVDAVKHALDRLVAAVGEVADRTVDLVRDDTVKTRTKEVAAALEKALNATLSQVGEAVDDLFHRRKDEPPPQ